MRLVAMIVVLGGGSCDPCPTSGPCPDDGTKGGTDGVPAEVEHEDIYGTTQSTDATVWLDLRPGVEVDLARIELDEPAEILVDSTLVALTTGYSIGTLLALHAVSIDADPLALDRDGAARLTAGTPLVLDVTATDTAGRSEDVLLETTLPWTLTVTPTTSGVSVAPWGDGLGGTFEIR